jgi:hypothetical protein
VQHLFALLKLPDQQIYPFDSQGIETLSNKPAVVLDFGFELLALVAHGLTALYVRRERAALSVIDKYRGQIDDSPSNIRRVRFRTLL